MALSTELEVTAPPHADEAAVPSLLLGGEEPLIRRVQGLMGKALFINFFIDSLREFFVW
jgi:hypothetical protein